MNSFLLIFQQIRLLAYKQPCKEFMHEKMVPNFKTASSCTLYAIIRTKADLLS